MMRVADTVFHRAGTGNVRLAPRRRRPIFANMGVDQPGFGHFLPPGAQAEHEQDMKDDPDNQHCDAKQHQREAEVSRRAAVRHDARFLQLLDIKVRSALIRVR
jgi:hypothetical protein